MEQGPQQALGVGWLPEQRRRDHHRQRDNSAARETQVFHCYPFIGATLESESLDPDQRTSRVD